MHRWIYSQLSDLKLSYLSNVCEQLYMMTRRCYIKTNECVLRAIMNIITGTQHEMYTLQWHDNGRDGSSNHRRLDCFSAVCWGADQRKHQSSPSLSVVRGIHRLPVNSSHKGPETGKCFHLMTSSWVPIRQKNHTQGLFCVLCCCGFVPGKPSHDFWSYITDTEKIIIAPIPVT